MTVKEASQTFAEKLQLWHVIVVLAVSILGPVLAFALSYGAIQYRLNSLEQSMRDLAGVDVKIERVQNDIDWIKERLREKD